MHYTNSEQTPINSDHILHTKNDITVTEIFNQMYGDVSTSTTFYSEKCQKCTNCRVCKLLRKTPTNPQIAISEQQSIKDGLVFNKEEKRYYSPMPWKTSPSLLRNNKDIAILAHQSMKRKAHKNKLHPPMIRETFQSMLDNHFIIKTDNLPEGNGKDDGLRTHIKNNPHCHFTVNTIAYKPSSQSTKTRITNDATRKTSKKAPSLNSLLMVGNPQYNISTMIMNWRLKPLIYQNFSTEFLSTQ